MIDIKFPHLRIDYSEDDSESRINPIHIFTCNELASLCIRNSDLATAITATVDEIIRLMTDSGCYDMTWPVIVFTSGNSHLLNRN